MIHYYIENENAPERWQPEETFPSKFYKVTWVRFCEGVAGWDQRWDRRLILSFLHRSFMEIYLPMKKFFHNLIHPEYSAVTDVYVLMFLADTVDFIIIVFGFWAFGVGRTIK